MIVNVNFNKKSHLNKKWNKDLCRCECKNPTRLYFSRKDYIWNPSTCAYKNDEYLGGIIDDSVIISIRWQKK